MGTRFEIPDADDNLFLPSDETYVAQQCEYTDEEIERQVHEFRGAIEEGEWTSISSFFDAFFCLAKYNSKSENFDLRINALSALTKALNNLSHAVLPLVIGDAINEIASLSEEMRNSLNEVSDALLMEIFLVYRLICHTEAELQRVTLAAEKRKGKNKAELGESMESYLKIREKTVIVLTNICSFHVVDNTGKVRNGAVKYLWRIHEMDKGLHRVIVETIFKFLDNPDSIRAVHRAFLTTVFGLLRQMSLNFDHQHRLAAGLVEKTTHLEYMKDTNAVYPFIDVIMNTSKEGDMNPFLTNIVRYVTSITTADFTNKTKPAPVKAYGLLIQALAEKAPHITINHLRSLLQYLENDPPGLRSAVLSAFTELLISDELREEKCRLYSKLMTLRDAMLNRLSDHLTDVHANVRAKCLNLWAKLAEFGALPMSRLNRGLISRIGRRLEDKNVIVRKAAVHFMSTFLTRNPYGHDFSYDLHVQELEKLRKQRIALIASDPNFEDVEKSAKPYEDKEEFIIGRLEYWFQAYLEDRMGLDIDPAQFDTLAEASLFTLVKSTEEAVEMLVFLGFKGGLKKYGIELKAEENKKEAVAVMAEKLKSLYLELNFSATSATTSAQISSEERHKDHVRALEKLDKRMQFLMNKLIIELEIEDCVPLALRGVMVGELAEMKEGLKFVVECKNFMIRGADKAVRALCFLIWKQNPDVRRAVLDAAGKMFVSSHRDKKVQDKSTADSLFAVVEGMHEDERGCVEEVICLMAAETFTDGVFHNVVKMIKNSDSNHVQLVALRLMGILARADKDKTRPALRVFQQLLIDKSKSVQLRAEALFVIANLAGQRQSNTDDAYRIPLRDSLFHYMEKFFMEVFYAPPKKNDEPEVWFYVIRDTLTICFDLILETTVVLGRLISRVMFTVKRVLDWYQYSCDEYEKEDGDEKRKKQLREMKEFWSVMYEAILERVLAMTGEIALRAMHHADVTYVHELKRLPEIVAAAKKGDIQAHELKYRLLRPWEMRSAMNWGMFDYSHKDENNPHGSSDEERIRTRSDQIVNEGLLQQGHLLARLLPLTVYCMRAECSSLKIRSAATMAFCKIMLLSRDFGERGAILFFALLGNSESPALRSNLMMAAGDLSLRIPNVIERYAHEIYAVTKDPDSRVRETALLIINYLTTNHILKMRGSLADVARCCLDPCKPIQTLTREFFTELGNMGSIILNLMPDFIARLSRNARIVNLKEFRVIMQFLIGLLKDRQADALVEKLCRRFDYAKGIRATEKNKDLPLYYSYCISQFQISDKAVSKMRDALPCYASFMQNDQIYEDFCACLQPLIKNTKNVDVKIDAEELEAQWTSLHEKGIRSDDLHAVSRIKPTRTARTTGKRGRDAGKTPNYRAVAAIPATVRRTGRQKKPRVVFSEGESDEDFED